jgi:type II secretory pathway pseudopilin PulG
MRRVGATCSQRGYTLIELLVTTLISMVFVLGLAQLFSNIVKRSYDQKVRIATVLQAQAILQTIGSELRILGNGVPFEQSEFKIGHEGLSDPTKSEPIIVATATNHHIEFRLNETGDVFVLTQDFDTALTDRTIYLTDVSSLQANDPIYLSNGVRALHDGLYGEVESVNTGTNSITLKAGYVASPGAKFPTGSTCEEVPIVTYDSPADNSGITRDSGYGPVALGAKSAMTLTYLDADGNTVPLNLDVTKLTNSLRAIRVTITNTSSNRLIGGNYYTTTVEQVFALRNLCLR